MASDSAKNFAYNQNYQVLILRHQCAIPHAQTTFQHYKHLVVEYPLFHVHPFPRVPLSFSDESVVLITSATALSVLQEPEWQAMHQAHRVLVVGKRSYDHCMKQTLCNTDGFFENSASLIDAVTQNAGYQGKEIIHLCGSVTHFDYERLRGHGYKLIQRALYELQVVPENLKQVERAMLNNDRLIIPIYSSQMARVLNPLLEAYASPDMILLPLSDRIRGELSTHHKATILGFPADDECVRNLLQSLGVFGHNGNIRRG